MFFATDSQFETNRLRRMDSEGCYDIATIEGSAIYSAQGPGTIYFSSTVEPGEGSGSLLRDMVERTPGPGIRSNEAVIYAWDGSTLEEVLRAEKDAWPMRLAQFGTFMFPQGPMPPNAFYAYGNAVRGYDDVTLQFERSA